LYIALYRCVPHSRKKCITIVIPVRLFACLSIFVCLSACISAGPTGSIYVRFDIEDFFGKLSRKSKFFLKSDKNWALYTKI
jgi:hypothetical protein